MTELTEANLHRAQKMLEVLIDTTEGARVTACKEKRTELRDQLDMVGAHLRMARGIAGSIEFDGVSTRSGDK